MADKDVEINLEVTGWREAMASIEKVMASAMDANQKMSAIGAIAGSLAGIAIFNGLTQSISALNNYLSTALDQFGALGERFEKINAQTGISAETFSVLGYAARTSGQNVESFTTGFRTLAKQVELAAAGNKNALKTFDELGVSIKTASGATISGEEAYIRSIQALGQVASETERAALASRLFGTSSRSILTIAGNYEKLKEEAQRLGVVLGGDTLRRAQELDNALDQLSEAAQGLKYAVADLVSEPLLVLIKSFGLIGDEAERSEARLKLFLKTLSLFPVIGLAAKKALDNFYDGLERPGQVKGKITDPAKDAYNTLEEVAKKLDDFWKTPGDKAAAAWNKMVPDVQAIADRFKGSKLGDAAQEMVWRLEAAAKSAKQMAELEKPEKEKDPAREMAAQVAQAEKLLKASDSLVYTWDEMGFRVVQTREEFEKNEKAVAAIAAEAKKVADYIQKDMVAAIERANAESEDMIYTWTEYGERLEIPRKQWDMMIDAEKQAQAEAKQLADQLVSGLEPSLSRITSGTYDWRDALRGVILDVGQIIYKLTVLKPIAEALAKTFESTSKAGGSGGFLGGVLKMLGIGGSSAPVNQVMNVESAAGIWDSASFGEFADGGQFKVGGVGGTDSQRVSFKASPDETVTITKPGQTASQSSEPVVQIVQNINISTGVQGTVRAEILRMLPAIQEASIAGVAAAKQRGGSRARQIS